VPSKAAEGCFSKLHVAQCSDEARPGNTPSPTEMEYKSPGIVYLVAAEVGMLSLLLDFGPRNRSQRDDDAVAR